MEDLRYPIGRFDHQGSVSEKDLLRWIEDIETLPERLRAAVEGLTAAQLDTPYRPGGWTVRQVVHHLGDSHLNSVLRFKWALTEDTPTIKTYDEARWAELADYERVPVSLGLDFLAVLHARWVALLRSLTPADLARAFVHPDMGRVELSWNIGLYAWHGRHHLAHLTGLINREGWADGSTPGASASPPA